MNYDNLLLEHAQRLLVQQLLLVHTSLPFPEVVMPLFQILLLGNFFFSLDIKPKPLIELVHQLRYIV